MEREAQTRKKYEDLAEKIKNLFPEGSVAVTNKEKEEEIVIAFGNNVSLCQAARGNLEDYKKVDKVDVGNNFTLPRSNKLIDMFNDDRQDLWRAAFKKITTLPSAAKTPVPPTQSQRKQATITTKRTKRNIETPVAPNSTLASSIVQPDLSTKLSLKAPASVEITANDKTRDEKTPRQTSRSRHGPQKEKTAASHF